MEGFSLTGFHGLIPCPFCGGTSCCSASKSKKGLNLVCINTETKKGEPRVVSAAALKREALKRGQPRYRIIDGGNGWELRLYVFVGPNYESSFRVGSVALYNKKHGYRGTCSSLEAAKKYLAKHGKDLSSHCGIGR